jgi:hypothetical protein
VQQAKLTAKSCAPHQCCVLDPKAGCRVVTRAVEEMRQALMQHYDRLSQIRDEWQTQSTFELLDAVDANYCDATHSGAGLGLWRLMEIARRVIAVTFHTTTAADVVSVPAAVLVRVEIRGAGQGYQFDIPGVPLSIAVNTWPYWLEAMRKVPSRELASFSSIDEFVRKLHFESDLVDAGILNGIELRRAKSGDFAIVSEQDLDLQVRQCEVLRLAVNLIENTTSRIGHSLRVIALATTMAEMSLSDFDTLVSQLGLSPGYQRMGTQLVDLLASRYRDGQFFIKQSELATVSGGPKTAFDSAVSALKAHELLIGAGLHGNQVLWTVPNICMLSTEHPRSHARGAVPKKGVAFDSLLSFAKSELTADQITAVHFIVEHGGSVSLEDLAFYMKWEPPIKNSWNGLKRRINERIDAHNRLPVKEREGVAEVSLRLLQRDNHAVLVPIPAINTGKTQETEKPARRPSTRKK